MLAFSISILLAHFLEELFYSINSCKILQVGIFYGLWDLCFSARLVRAPFCKIGKTRPKFDKNGQNRGRRPNLKPKLDFTIAAKNVVNTNFKM
jgi:hypothetical protein